MCNCRRPTRYGTRDNRSPCHTPTTRDTPCTTLGDRLRFRNFEPEALEPRQLLDGGGVPPGMDLAQANWFYQNVFLPPANVAPEWNGNVATDDAGTLGPGYLAAIVARVNAYRWMAGLPGGITLDPTENDEAQQAALMMAANGQLNHDPPPTWIDYTAEGANAAGHSNLAQVNGLPSGTNSIDLFMSDLGDNNTSVGHRRWVLYPPTQTMGVGDIPAATTALYVIQPDDPPAPSVTVVAWPPAGFVPDALIPDRWSLQAPYGSDFSNATVAVTENGVSQEVEILSNSGPEYGGQAIVWNMPDAPAPQPGQQAVYAVQVDNVLINGQSQSFSYTTTSFDPSATTESTPVPAAVGFLQASAQPDTTNGSITIDVARGMNADQQFSVDYSTVDGTALAGTNYVSTSGVLTFGPGQFYSQIVVPILPGNTAQPGGTFFVTLSTPTDASVGPISSFEVEIDGLPLAQPAPPVLLPADDSGKQGDGITDVASPSLTGITFAGATVQLLDGKDDVIATATANGSGVYVIPLSGPLTPQTYQFSVEMVDQYGDVSSPSAAFSLTIVAPPTTPSAPALVPADDSGKQGDGITDVASPSLTGITFAGATVQLLDGKDDVIATATANGSGVYVIPLSGPLTPQTYQFSVEMVDQYGDVSSPSAAFSLTIVAPPTTPSAPALVPADDSGKQGDGITDVASPSLTGITSAGATVQLLDGKDDVIATATANGSGVYVIPLSGPLTPQTYQFSVEMVDQYGDVSSPSAAFSLTIVAPPTTPSAPALVPADDSGKQGDGITDVASPSLTGITFAGATVQLLDGKDDVIATATANGSGVYVIPLLGPLTPQTFQFSVETVDQYGDVSSPSAAFSLTIVAPPTTPSAPALVPADDSGKQGDGITDVGSPSLTGITFVGASVQLLDGKDDVIATATANGSGVYVIPLSGPLTPQTYQFSVETVDQYGDVSSPSAAFSPTIVAPPTTPNAPALVPADDSGEQGDGITDVGSPSLTGITFVGASVQLLDGKDDVIATATANGSGVYVLPLPGALAPQTYQYSVQTIDQYGDVSMPSMAFALTVVARPSTPTAPTLLPSDSDGSHGGETTTSITPLLIGMTIPGATVRLLGPNATVLETTIASASGGYEIQVPGPLGAGAHTYQVDVIDKYGDVSGPSPAQTITVVNPPPPPPPPPALVTVGSSQLEKIKVGTGKNAKKETVLVVQFSGALNAASADNASAYELAPIITVKAKGKGKHKKPPTTRLGPPLPPASVVYNSSNNQVTLLLRSTLNLTKPEELTVNATLVTDTLGREIDGDDDGQPGSDYIATINGSRVTPGGLPRARSPERSTTVPVTIDALLARGELADWTRTLRARREGHHQDS